MLKSKRFIVVAIAIIAIVVVGACRINGSSKGDVDSSGFATFRNRMLPIVLSAAGHDKKIARF